MKRPYRYLVEDVDKNGNVRIYFRRKGQPKIRIRATPGTVAFDHEYRLAFDGTTVKPTTVVKRDVAKPGTMRWLCEQYYVAPAFLLLDSTTRRVRRRLFDRICERAGSFRYDQMQPSHVAKLRDEKSATPESANAIVKSLRQLFTWAMLPEYSHARTNPARQIKYLKSNNPDGHRIWSEDDVAKFEARHPVGTKARLALDLFLYTGVRISDAARLGPQMEWNGKLVFSEFKNRNHVRKNHAIPILPPLRASIDATATGHLVYLITEAGHPYSVKGLGQWFGRQRQMAELDKGLSAHGLRKTGAVRCVEAGATHDELMALFGWATHQQVELYIRKADRTKLEAKAANLLRRNPAGTSESQ